ncbi:MAG TPA: hypothetical protein VID03_01990 [Acidimicrobiia bacterium]
MRGRIVLSWIMVVLVGMTVPLSLAALWVRSELLNTERYVATVAPLVDDPAIVEGVSTRAAGALTEALGVGTRIEDALPEVGAVVGPALADAFNGWMEGVVAQVLESDLFARVWMGANRAAHQAFVRVVTGPHEGGAATINEQGTLVLDLNPVFAMVKDRLAQSGFTGLDRLSLDNLSLQYELFTLEAIPGARKAVETLQTLAWVLPVVAILAAVAATMTAGKPRIWIRRVFAAVAIGSLVLWLVLAWVGSSYLADTPAAAAAFETIASLLLTAAKVATAIGVVGWLVALVFLRPRAAEVSGVSPP